MSRNDSDAQAASGLNNNRQDTTTITVWLCCSLYHLVNEMIMISPYAADSSISLIDQFLGSSDECTHLCHIQNADSAAMD